MSKEQHIYNYSTNETVTIELSRYERMKQELADLRELILKAGEDSYVIDSNYFGTAFYHKNRKDFDSKLIELNKAQRREIMTLKEQLSRLDGKSFWQRLFN